jgi:hypothetical protein
MNEDELIPVYHVDDVPHFDSLEEAATWWDAHFITEEYVAEARARGLIRERPADRIAQQKAARERSGQ